MTVPPGGKCKLLRCKWDSQEEKESIIWVADTGDGFTATSKAAQNIRQVPSDVVVCGGDLVYPFTDDERFFTQLRAVYEDSKVMETSDRLVYFILGNHDYYGWHSCLADKTISGVQQENFWTWIRK